MDKKIYWNNWLENELERREKVYLTDPDQLISDYNREIDHSRGYSGRGLLELIQNADDAGIDYPKSNKLMIKLTDFGLFVANTGKPFSEKGIKSLIVSDNSPKQFRTECIGYKGLGFRSVLDWTSSLIIFSGELSVGFDEKFSSDFLEDLKKKSDEIDEKVKQFEGSGVSNPIATLSVPKFLSEKNIEKEDLLEIYREGKKIRKKGYDTVICISLTDSEKKNQVQREINSLFKEISLFLRNLDEIKIRSPDRNEDWRVDRGKEKVVVNPKKSDSTKWRIFEDKGAIPQKFQETNQIKDKYEIKIAVPISSDNFRTQSHDLFVFFPTKVSFPFPILTHATFEVTENRNHLTNSDTNHFVARKLASLMTETAEKLRSETDDPWFGLSLVSPKGEIGSTLKELGSKKDYKGFKYILRKNIRKSKLIPVQNGDFKAPNETKRVNGYFDDLLKGDLFNDVCLYPSNRRLRNQLENLKISEIDYDDFKSRINEISSDLSLEKRAEFIKRLVESEMLGEKNPPKILVDGEEKEISPDITVFLPPSGEMISLPQWVPRKILHPELTSLLESKFNVNRIRDLRLKLKSFSVREYNLAGLVTSIVAETNRKVNENPQKEMEWRKDMLSALWELYSSQEENVKLHEVSIKLPTRKANFKKASLLYLGKEYPNGEVLEYIYGPIKTDPFVISHKKLEFCSKPNEIENFLCWLGVNYKPRKVKSDVKNPDYLDYVLNNLNYPAKFDDLMLEEANQVRDANPHFENIQNIDGLEEILEKSDPHAIICWLATIGKELDSWRQNGDKNAVFKVRPKYKKNERKLEDQVLPSYPLWMLRNKEWLPTKGGIKKPPKTCSIEPSVKDLSPIVGYPALNMDNSLIKDLNIDETSIRVILTKIGVKNNLEELSWDSFYEILLKLSTLDAEGKNARRVYRVLIESVSGDDTPSGKKYEKFMENGKMLGKHGEEIDYYPIDKLYYLENATLPESIVERYPILELDQRRGVKKVENFFGVEELSMKEINIKNLEYTEHSLSKEFKSEVKRLKPFIYALRVDKHQALKDRNRIKNLEVYLCESVEVLVSIKEDEFEIELDDGKFITKDSKVFLVYDLQEFKNEIFADSNLAFLIGDIFANLLEVNLRNKVRILASSNDRKSELNNLIGGDTTERLSKAKKYLSGDKNFENSFVTPEQPKVVEMGSKEVEKSKELVSEETEKEKEGPEREEKPKELKISEKDVPVTSKREIELRRVKRKRRSPISTERRKIADADLAEEIAIKFEKKKDRFPIKVSNIQGGESYGCDIISFSTKERKKKFMKEENMGMIDRFIEVKGSTRKKGSTTLKDNELESAQEKQELFHIYRIYENSEEPGAFELVSLKDPLGVSEALKRKIEVNPFHTDKSKCFELRSSENNTSKEEMEE